MNSANEGSLISNTLEGSTACCNLFVMNWASEDPFYVLFRVTSKIMSIVRVRGLRVDIFRFSFSQMGSFTRIFGERTCSYFFGVA